MDYFQMTKKLSDLGVSTFNFKESVKFQNLDLGFEIDFPRSNLPRKNATPEQCAYVFEKVTELLEHEKLKVENQRYKEALEEVRACVDSLYDNGSPRRMHPELAKYAGFIHVMDKVTFEALKSKEDV